MKFFLSILALLTSTGLARACELEGHYDIEDVLLADVVVVGRVEAYKVTERLDQDQLPGLEITVEIEVRVDELLAGNVPERFHATWSDPYQGLYLPQLAQIAQLDRQVLMAFRDSNLTKWLPWEDKNSAYRSSAQLPLSLLQMPCAKGFMFPASSDFAQSMRELLLQ